ncbi:DNA-binding transcriptional regulator, LysR family [Eubacterium ruminantium]|nr:DNA-binding transcriptional regulator, LysR family [Eubacterium ruminantium]
MNTNLEYYKIFYHVASLGSFTEASKVLCITQPAVSQGIKLLESSLGLQLFRRTTRGAVLTHEGETLFNYVSSGYEAFEKGEQKLKELLSLDSGEIRIGASDMTLQYYLLPYLEKFHQLYPKVKVNVTNAPTPRTLEHLASGRIDLGIVSASDEFADFQNIGTYLSTSFPPKLKVRQVRDIEDIFIAGNRFSHLRDKTLSLHDLETLPLICLEPDTSTRKYVDGFLYSEGVTLAPEFELSTSNMIVQFVMRNLGIGSVVADFAEEYIKNGNIFRLKLDKDIPKRKICVITDNSNPTSIAAKKLLELL